jgi:hypothetical protein
LQAGKEGAQDKSQAQRASWPRDDAFHPVRAVNRVDFSTGSYAERQWPVCVKCNDGFIRIPWF